MSIVNDFAAIKNALPTADPAASDGDAAILALFRDWCDLQRAAQTASNGEDGEAGPILDESYRILDEIETVPAMTGAGLAIKIYLLIHQEDGTFAEDGAALGKGAANYPKTTSGILRSAICFVPELAPLCRHYLAAQSQPLVPSGDSASDGGPLPAMWAERNRLDALAVEADKAFNADRLEELDDQRFAIEEAMARTTAITLAGVKAQFDLLELIMVDAPQKALLSTIRAGLLTIRTQAAPPLPAGGDDAELFAAERELGALRSPDGDSEALDPGCVRAIALERKIAATTPATLAGAAVKLRALADPDTGIEIGANCEDAGSIRQVLAMIDRLVQP